MVNADAALRIDLRMDGLETPAPNITREKATMQGGKPAGEKFQCFGNFERGDQIHDWAKDADGVASFLEAGGTRGIEQAGEAGSFAGEDGHRKPVAGNGSRVDPGSAGLDGEIIDKEPGFEIVCAVEDESRALEQLDGVTRSQVRDYAFDLHVRIDEVEVPLGSNGLRQSFTSV